jgi:hypothetical protein
MKALIHIPFLYPVALSSLFALGCFSTIATAQSQGRCLKGTCQEGQGIYLESNQDFYQGAFSKGRFHGEGILSGTQSTYVGHFEKGKKSGQGTLADFKGRFYRGAWLADQPHGQGVEISAQGDIYEGEWQNGQKQGLGVQYLSTGQMEKGRFLKGKFEKVQADLKARPYQKLGNAQSESYLGHITPQGQPDGYGTWYSQSGKITGRGQFEKGQIKSAFFVSAGQNYYLGSMLQSLMQGQGVLTFANGNRYLGEFKQDKMAGQGLLLLNNQQVYQGDFRDNQPEGQGTVYFPNGDVYTGGFVKGLKQGPGTLKSNGKTTELQFDKDKQVATKQQLRADAAEAAEAATAGLIRQRDRWISEGRRIVLDKTYVHERRYLHTGTMQGELKLQAGEDCAVVVLGPPGSELVGFQLTASTGSSKWVYNPPGKIIASTNIPITETRSYSLLFKGRKKGKSKVSLQALMACK